MSGALLIVEAVGISAAAVGVVLAQNPPEDLRDWWARQAWLHRMIMPMDDERGTARGLSILPWEADEPADDGARPDEVTPATDPAPGPRFSDTI